ncbi:molybdopterin-dependent oxidoreductase [Chryseobacterium aurantiacum]|uniref:molybdopterin-dependent oxidoreductase n=1 Tax=Chryseobacterium aurantiacum TaxID=2116499 RepID=UPI000D1276B5|nr:molybdopterin-dependent oxidoreductase [Chryseobacterium aurantiacum]
MEKITKLAALIVAILVMLQCKKTELTSHLQKDTPAVSQNIKASEDQHQHTHTDQDDSKYISKELKIIGDVVNPLTITVDSLKKMNVREFKDFKIVCQSGLTKESIHSTKGVLLKDILEKAKIIQKDHTDRNFYIVAKATDGYKATFSWGEIFNNPTGEQIYVVFEQNGEPLKNKGEMVLVSLNDTKTGPRHVKWLKSIEVTRVQ